MIKRLLSCVAMLCFCQPVGAQHAAEINAPQSEAESLNADFRKMYAAARTEYKAKTSPVIISMLGNVVLVRNGVREAIPVTTPEWQTLKTVDHVPLAIFVGLVNHTDRPLAKEKIDELNTLRGKTLAAEPEILAAHLSPETAARQKIMLEQCRAFIDEVTKNGCVTRDRLNAFARSMMKMTMLNADDAEVIELGIVDANVRRWRQSMTPEEWKNLRVVISDVHMALKQERILLYFQALLRERTEGGRIVTIENGDDEQKAIDLLATHRLDEQIGIGFFRDPERMHRDLLGDAAKLYIRKHPPAR